MPKSWEENLQKAPGSEEKNTRQKTTKGKKDLSMKWLLSLGCFLLSLSVVFSGIVMLDSLSRTHQWTNSRVSCIFLPIGRTAFSHQTKSCLSNKGGCKTSVISPWNSFQGCIIHTNSQILIWTHIIRSASWPALCLPAGGYSAHRSSCWNRVWGI